MKHHIIWLAIGLMLGLVLALPLKALASGGDDELPEVGAQEDGKQTSPIVDEGAKKPAEGADAKADCWFNGTQYSPGAEVCSSGVRLKCSSGGQWVRYGKC